MRIKNPAIHVVLTVVVGFFAWQNILSPKGRAAFAARDKIVRVLDNLLDGTTAPRSPAERSLTGFFARHPQGHNGQVTTLEVEVGKTTYEQAYMRVLGGGPKACAVFRRDPITLVAFYPERCSRERTRDEIARQEVPPVKP